MPFASAGSAACHHYGLAGHLEQMLDGQAACVEPDAFGGLRLGARDLIEQAGPLDDDDALPRLWRDRRSEVVALADRQVTEPPSGVACLPDVEQDAVGEVHAVYRMA